MSITFFHAAGSRTIKAFNEAVTSDLIPNIQMTVAYKDTKPKRAHVVLVSGDGAPSKEVERFAVKLGAFPVCIPEASEWLTNRVRQSMELGLEFVMVDAALAGTNSYSGAK